MRRAIVRTVDGEAVTDYVDCGPSRAGFRKGAMTAADVPSGLRMPDFLFQHPAAQVQKAPGERVSR